MTIDRRRALALALVGLGAAAPAGACAVVGRGGASVRFLHGVASGDPLADRVVLWTRVTPAVPGAPVRVVCELREAGSDRIARRVKAVTGPERDYTVKLDVTGLKPATEYAYVFTAGGVSSPRGRTRTLPEAGVNSAMLAVVSCSLHPSGLFNVYDAVAKLERVEAVVHLGDYIYEYGAAPNAYGMQAGLKLGRIPEPPHETVTLDDYRKRHAQYKTDPDLQAAHARAPWICVFDDHEVTNDPWRDGAENHDKDEGDWGARKAAALKAYFEWMPIREPGTVDHSAVRRSFRFGDVASLHMIETRLTARTKQLDYDADLKTVTGPDGKPVPDLPSFQRALNDPSRELMGPEQLAWLGEDLSASVKDGVAWQVIGNQIVMARTPGPDIAKAIGADRLAGALAQMPEGRRRRLQQTAALFAAGVPMNLDAWDGYPAERERLYEVFKASGARPVVLSGDSHAFWATELSDAAGRRVGVEFGTSAVSSPPTSLSTAIPGLDVGQVIAAQAPEVVHCDMGPRGYILLTLTREEARAELIGVSTVTEKPYAVLPLKTFRATAADPATLRG